MKKILMFLLTAIPFFSFAKVEKKLKSDLENVFGNQVQIEEIDICESKMGTQDIWFN